VLGYIDTQLLLPRFANQAELVKRGVGYLDAVARRTHGNRRFHELPDDAKDEILARFQRGELEGVQFPTADFFEVMMSFTLEGTFGDPKHGGNRGKIAWTWLGVDPSCGQMHACGG
jgi:gluconate 2-dehydrogenase gamma chain